MLTPRQGEPGVLVLVLEAQGDDPNADAYRNNEGSIADVEGTFSVLTPENVDRGNSDLIDGEALVRALAGTGTQYIILGNVLSVH